MAITFTKFLMPNGELLWLDPGSVVALHKSSFSDGTPRAFTDIYLIDVGTPFTVSPSPQNVLRLLREAGIGDLRNPPPPLPPT